MNPTNPTESLTGSMNHWLRLYTDILENPKVQRLPSDHFKGWVNLLCLAKENDGVLPSTEDIAFRLRLTDAEAATLVEELTKRGLLDTDGETLKPHNWDGRQYKSDVSAERTKQSREDKAGDNAQGKGVNYVYFIGTTIDKIVKIGISKNPWARVAECQTGSPEILNVLATFRGSAFSEWDIHQTLTKYRQHGEWFVLPENIQRLVIKATADKLNYDELAALLRVELRSTSVGPPTELRANYVVGELRASYATTTEYRAETDSETDSEQSRAPRAAKRATARRSNVCDEEFLAELQANPAYAMFDVRRLYHKMVAWCTEKHKQPTRGRLLNWLNREDKPMGGSNGKTDTGKTGFNEADRGSSQRTTEDYGIRDCKVL